MARLPKIIVTTSSGKECRIEFEEAGDSIAAKITWCGPGATAQDHAEGEAAALMMMEGRLDPHADIFSRDMGRDKAARDAAVKRFLAGGSLKTNEN